MGLLGSRPIRTLLVSSTAMALVVACGSEGGSTFNPGGNGDDGGAGPPPPSLGSPDAGGTAPVTEPRCKPRTCADQGIECGPAGDGCGGIIQDCGQCADGLRCGGPNAPSKCVSANTATNCTPKTCAELGVGCGAAGDGCGGVLSCGTCPSGQQCGGVDAFAKCVAATATGPDGGACVPKTCADHKLEGRDCGVQSDGCGGVTPNCGTCNTAAGEFCGGGGPSKCAISGGGTCTPKTCADYPGKCGPQPNGCGGVTADCGTCVSPKVCGGGGIPSVCGGGGVTSADGGTCTPITTCGPTQCGIIADGCGGTLDCGMGNCTSGQICGGSGTPNVCGKPACTPITFCPAGMNCGSIADGCGGTVTCGGACTPPQICGGGGQPNVCGGGSVVADGGGTCTPITACQPNQCGPIANGCGGILNCPDCTGGAVCGGGGTPSVCAGGTCTPRTAADCATLGLNCGFIADGCGGPPVQCGATCPNGGVCGLNSPNVCSSASANCTNLCLDQPTDCSGPNTTNTTTVTGTVYMPNGTLPVYDALVYVPNEPLTAVPTGIGTCDSCSAQASGAPLVSAKTNAQGQFTLTNMPHRVGGVPLVIQKGRWRKQVTVNTTRCGTVNLSAATTSFGKTQSATNNIPKFAVTTGGADALQCLLRKIGIADSEFTQPAGNGRVNLFAGSGGTNQYRSNPTFNGYTGTGTWTPANQNTRNLPNETVLYGDNTGNNAGVVDTDRLFQYDAVVLTCTGSESATALANYRAEMKAYADAGGKIFASHWHHGWLEYGPSPWGGRNNPPTPPLAPIATINHQADLSSPITGTINTSFPKGLALSQWLQAAGSTAPAGTISITGAQHTIDAVDTTRATAWITIPSQNSVQYFDFNTPVGAATQCGRFVISDLHVSRDDVNADFPNGCTSTGMTDQEKVLAFMLFDLTSCVNQPQPPTCTPKTCANYPAGTCGQQSDGCGGLTANCGSCTLPATCGGAGVPNQCGVGGSCTPKTCPQLGAECGQVPDGCGNLLTCSPCPTGTTCGGGGVANKCGAPSCTPRTCAQQGIECGQTGDGCGNLLTCPPCPTGTTCGGGGVPNQCGAPSCTPLTQCPPGKDCGTMPNGCGGVITCGTCPAGQTCGGGGAPNVCGAASCSPKTCTDLGAQCGVVSDQCGGTATCPQCPNGQFCNGQNICVATTCTPKTCAELGVECGPTADTCGGVIQCPECPAGTVCGGGGVPGKCGKNPCTPKTCTELDAECGRVADGCGGLTADCGTCAGATSCSNGVCVNACKPRTCAEASAQCGPISDGCGGIVDCGPCPPGQECGYNNLANTCGSGGPK